MWPDGGGGNLPLDLGEHSHPRGAPGRLPAPSCLPECGGHAAAELSSPGAPDEPCLSSRASVRSIAFCKQAESKPPAKLGEVNSSVFTLSLSAGVSGTAGQRDSVGRDPWNSPVDWKHQMVALVLYRLLFKPLKIILTGRKRIPDFSFAATSVPQERTDPTLFASPVSAVRG